MKCRYIGGKYMLFVTTNSDQDDVGENDEGLDVEELM
jgi:hypothetical protein